MDLLVDSFFVLLFALVGVLDLLRLRNPLARYKAVYRSVLNEGVSQLLATPDELRVRGPL